MKSQSILLGIIFTLVVQTVLAVDIRYIERGDTYYLYKVVGENDLVVVQYVDKENNRVKIRYVNGAVDWVAPSKLLTQSESDEADFKTRAAGTAVAVAAFVCLVNPDACKDKTPARATSSSKNITITLVNRHCKAIDYYVNEQLAVSSLPTGMQSSFTTAPGQKQVKACETKTSSCGKPVSVNWTSSTAAGVDPGSSCKATVKAGPWPLDPLIPGGWRNIGATDKAAVLKALAATSGKHRDLAGRITRLRALQLPFYRNVVLYEGQVEKNAGLATFVRYPGGVVMLDGSSKVIQALNAEAPLMLANNQQVEAYLRFFTAAIQASDGTFRIVEKPADLSWADHARAADKAAVNSKITRLKIARKDATSWEATATITYGNNLFQSLFRVNQDGGVEMVDDTPLAENLPIRPMKYGAGVRYEDASLRKIS